MITAIMKWISIAWLFFGLLSRSSDSYVLLLEVVVCSGAILAVSQTVRAGRYFWAAGFSTIAVVFNPIVPIVFSPRVFFWLEMLSIGTFLASLAVLKAKPKLSIPSTTDRTLESESQ